MKFEIERKWLPSEELICKIKENYEAVIIEQGYLCTEPVVRVRKDGDEYYLTYKGKGGLIHEEYNLPLTETAYASLIKKSEGSVIRKRRYRVKFCDLFVPDDFSTEDTEKDLVMELDVFEGNLKGLVILETEFDSEQSAVLFSPPEQFGNEVTGKKEYTNAYLSSKN